LDVNERLPCFATAAPAPAATNAAAVETLNVEIAPPPVPHVSIRCGRSVVTRSIARRSARAAPATSAGVSPLTRSAIRRAASWAGVASPRMTASNTSAARVSGRDSRRERAAMACESGAGASGIDLVGGLQRYPEKSPFVKQDNRLHRLKGPRPSSIFRA